MPSISPILDNSVPYLGPTNVRVFLKDIWLDDVASINFSIADNKIPFFGFKSFNFDAMGHGPTLVSGTITTIFRYPGYLSYAIQGLLATKNGTSLEDIKSLAQSTNTIPITEKNNPSDMADYIKELALKRDLSKLSELKDTLGRVFYPAPGNNGTSSRPGILQRKLNQPIDLTVVYGRIDGKDVYSHSQVIKDVYMEAQGQQLSILNGDGDTALYEQYSFVAKDVI